MPLAHKGSSNLVSGWPHPPKNLASRGGVMSQRNVATRTTAAGWANVAESASGNTAASTKTLTIQRSMVWFLVSSGIPA